MSDVLIAEISGKRPGDKNIRKTEKWATQLDHVIISNNSEGYVTDWPIVNVPDDYREWYISHVKSSDNAWYAPMNRSYAIKYAREHGYKYLTQLDDNIELMEIASLGKRNGVLKRFRYVAKKEDPILDDFIQMHKTVLENSNAVMAGCALAGMGTPNETFLAERYCYSLFTLDLSSCPDVFQGDFEDDIEYRLKCQQMGIPAIQIAPLRYGKTGQQGNKDLSGCREEYVKAGLKRGEHMNILYPDYYSCKMTHRRHHVHSVEDNNIVQFTHRLKVFKVGCVIYDMEPITNGMTELFKKYSRKNEDKVLIKQKKVKLNGGKK